MIDASLPAGRFSDGEFRIGRVFSRTWSVFSSHFLTFVLVTGIANLPSLFIPRPAPGAPMPLSPFQLVGVTFAALVLLMVLWVLSQAVLLYAAFQAMQGRPIDLAESARIGLRRFFPIIGVVLSVGLLVGLASLLLVVPGIMLYIAWSVATPVCVVERLGPFSSMGRSRELTRGHRWKIFGMWLLILLVAVIVGGILGGLAFAILGANGILALSAAMSTLVGQIVNLVWSSIWTAFFSILIVVTYHDLRVAKEGIDTDQIAAVFD
ncbi:MAG TPA: hypothetical protein VKW08_05375 [Xanthobacteraceae bacterium]|nr:hypothetical protein [Xanthobacteraceae bacterium]